MKMTDSELCIRGFTVLAQTFGDVYAERFVALMNREPFDYTEWRRTHLYVDEDLDSLADRAKAAGARVRSQYGDAQKKLRQGSGCEMYRLGNSTSLMPPSVMRTP